MPTFERATTFDAPLDAVWDLHTTGDGLEQLTPSFLGLRVEGVRGGRPDEPLPEGAEIDVSAASPGPGGRTRWTGVVVASDRDGTTGLFRDEMRGGPFPEWVHTHQFAAVDGGTRMLDRIEYRLPTRAGDVLGRFGVVGFEPVFRYRHWRATGLLE